MANLRLLKQRTQSTEEGHQEADSSELRGLSDPDLFHKSGVSVHLIVTGKCDLDHIKTLCEAYNLTSTHHPEHHGRISLSHRWQMPGKHKEQALALYYAALELHYHSPKAHILLHHAVGLHTVLHERIHNTHPDHSSHLHHEAFEKWNSSHAEICLDGAVSLYLTQAGIQLPASGSFVELHHAEIERLTENKKAHAEIERKVG